MFSISEIIDIDPYGLDHAEKSSLYLRALADLTRHHREKCPNYRKIIDALGYQPGQIRAVEDIPFIPVRIFKDAKMLSVDDGDIVKTLTSSGTSGQNVSRIFLDKVTATSQSKVLTRIVSNFVGKKRLPMIIIDSASTVKNRTTFSARGAGILGFSIFGNDIHYALDDNLNVDLPGLAAFIEKHNGGPFLLFGFTFIVWEQLHCQLKAQGKRLSLGESTLIHGGGWKQMADRAVDNATYKSALAETTGLKRIINYYGMAEQTGSIFMECEHGVLHSSVFSDILIRSPQDFSSQAHGQEGVIQLLSLLPVSYPGHSILSEDLGVILGEDDCKCGRKGKYFRVSGRLKGAEIRGCSDTYGAR